MGFLNYSRAGDVIEIIIRDFSGAKIESHSCNANDKKKYGAILRYLKSKYGFEPEIDFDESINAKNEKREDVDWFGWSG